MLHYMCDYLYLRLIHKCSLYTSNYSTFKVISWIIQAFQLVLTYKHMDDVIINSSFASVSHKQMDSELLWVCSVMDHRRHPKVVRASVTHLAVPCVPIFFLFVIAVWCHLWSITGQTHGNIESICKSDLLWILK